MGMVKRISDEPKRWLQLRPPLSLYEWLANRSRENGRSMAAEVLQILKREKNRMHPPATYDGIEPF